MWGCWMLIDILICKSTLTNKWRNSNRIEEAIRLAQQPPAPQRQPHGR
jgi:hypothetical protein